MFFQWHFYWAIWPYYCEINSDSSQRSEYIHTMADCMMLMSSHCVVDTELLFKATLNKLLLDYRHFVIGSLLFSVFTWIFLWFAASNIIWLIAFIFLILTFLLVFPLGSVSYKPHETNSDKHFISLHVLKICFVSMEKKGKTPKNLPNYLMQ